MNGFTSSELYLFLCAAQNQVHLVYVMRLPQEEITKAVATLNKITAAYYAQLEKEGR